MLQYRKIIGFGQGIQTKSSVSLVSRYLKVNMKIKGLPMFSSSQRLFSLLAGTVLIFSALGTIPCLGQSKSLAGVAGRVTDSTGAVVPNVDIM